MKTTTTTASSAPAPAPAPAAPPALTLTFALGIGLFSLALFACRDVSKFSSRGDHFEGLVTNGSFVRAGVSADTKMCLTLDTDHLQDSPGTLTTNDGRFQATPLRPIPQIWHDPLSTLSFGDGRIENLVYAATPLVADGGPEEAQDVFVVLSLMQQTRHVEVRLLRGAPQVDAGAVPQGVATALFGVFHLEREEGPCAF